uniref:Uncharacterized protein LOC114329263 n=1 Tax=Diabrotica virgifera virgifera TaxID=50390 RepID=A0A6P7FGR5_DIAVI
MFKLKVVILFLAISNVFCRSPILDAVENFIINYRKFFNVSDAVFEPYPDLGLDIYQFLAKYHYPVETHWVKTEDGYVLRMQRLLGGQNGTHANTKHKPAVLLMHGILCSAMDFVNYGPNRSIALMLADEGYDVWLGNNRGTTWSRMHETLDPDNDREYYDYSFDECGYYDLPAKIDYIVNNTGQEKIFHVGHSQGTSQFFAMAALRPEYNEKIALMSALAPVAYMHHISSQDSRTMSQYLDILEFLLADILNIHSLLPYSWIYTELAKFYIVLTHFVPPAQEIGALVAFFCFGFNNRQFDRLFVPNILSNAPAGISLKTAIHYAQEIISGKFRRYDYKLGNLKKYKSLFPPNYNLSAITAPIALYYSQNDYIVAVKDVEKLAKKLPNVVKLQLVDRRFNHLDYLWAKDVHTILNDDVIATQNKYIPVDPHPKGSANTIYGKAICFQVVTMIIVVLTMYIIKIFFKNTNNFNYCLIQDILVEMIKLKVVILLLTISNVFCKNTTLDAIGNYIRNYRKSFNVSDAVFEPYSDLGLDIYKFLAKYNYPVETHWVKTEDGYILRMQRLVGGQNGTHVNTKDKPAVLLMHGLLSSAMDFVNYGPNRSIALMLADEGYDVWLGNNRGTTWSRMHETLDPDNDAKYYDYSFDECGYYDLPAKIDYIVNKTGQEKIFYIGHSQGTSQFFAMAALRPEYNEKIALMSALAPVAYMNHMSSTSLRIVSQYLDILKLILVDILNIHSLLSHSWIYTELAKLYIVITDVVPQAKEIGAIVAFFSSGFNNREFDRSFVPIILSNAPAGISSKMAIHYGQEIISGKFRRYDYQLGNYEKYNSLFPPDYNLSAITAPIVLYYSKNDYMVGVKDVERLSKELPNVVKLQLVQDRRFNHLDYLWAKDVHTILNDDVIATQNKYIPVDPQPKGSANTIYGRIACFPVLTMIIVVLAI